MKGSSDNPLPEPQRHINIKKTSREDKCYGTAKRTGAAERISEY